MDSIKKLCDEVETVNGFCCLGDRLHSSSSCEAAFTARLRIGWVRFRVCGELLLGNRFPLRMKSNVYGCCIRSARTWRAMVRAMGSQKVINRKTTEEQMDMLELKKL